MTETSWLMLPVPDADCFCCGLNCFRNQIAFIGQVSLVWACQRCDRPAMQTKLSDFRNTFICRTIASEVENMPFAKALVGCQTCNHGITKTCRSRSCSHSCGEQLQ